MSNIQQIHVGMSMSNEIKNDYEDNVEFVYHEFSNILVDLVSFLPFLSGMFDVFILNKLGIFSLTWFMVTSIVGAVLCVIDLDKLRKLNYNIDNMFFWAVSFPLAYLFIRSKTVKSGGYLPCFYIMSFVVVWSFSPL